MFREKYANTRTADALASFSHLHALIMLDNRAFVIHEATVIHRFHVYVEKWIQMQINDTFQVLWKKTLHISTQYRKWIRKNMWITLIKPWNMSQNRHVLSQSHTYWIPSCRCRHWYNLVVTSWLYPNPSCLWNNKIDVIHISHEHASFCSCTCHIFCCVCKCFIDRINWYFVHLAVFVLLNT